MTDSEWLGDNQNGVEFRRHEDGTIDEVCVYIDGQCVVHTERMDDTYFWMGIYTKAGDASVTFHSKSWRAFVDCNGETDT